MNVRKRATNRSKTEAKAKTNTGVSGKGGVLDADLGWSTIFLVGGRLDFFLFGRR